MIRQIIEFNLLFFFDIIFHLQDENFDMPRNSLLPYFGAERFSRTEGPFYVANVAEDYDPGINLYYCEVPGGKPVLGV